MRRVLPTVFCAISLLAGYAIPAVAQGLPGATVRPEGKSGVSAERPAQRSEARGRMQERCKENPKQCEEMKAKLKQAREQCKADPKKCRDDMRARREERCKANPKQCEELKAKLQQRREQCKAHPEQCRPAAGRKPDST